MHEMKFWPIFCIFLLSALSCTNAMRKFSAHIRGGLKPNQLLTLHGSFHSTAGSVTFRLQDTDDYDFPNTIMFDLGIDLIKNITQRNTFTNGQWATVESYGTFPFDKRQPFKITIHTTENAFEIFVNDKNEWTFNHRLPLDTAKYFVALGDMDINNVDFFENQETEYVVTNPNIEHFEKPNYPVLPVKQPLVPFFGTLWKEWQVSEAYVVRGTVKSVTSENINIDFLGNPTPDNNVALRLSIRFTENKVYRQSLIAEKWRTEETSGEFPFALGHSFEIAVVADYDHFKILVNGKLLWTHKYTLELSHVAYVHIDGPVTISIVSPGSYEGALLNCITDTDKQSTSTNTMSRLVPIASYKVASIAPAIIPNKVCDKIFSNTLPVLSPSVPFIAYIPYSEREEIGQRIVVTGYFNREIGPGSGQWIEIRLQPCPLHATNNDIAVTVSIRFDTKIITTFDYYNKKWTANAVQKNEFPVTKGGHFSITFVRGRNSYKIYVNNRYFIDHPHHNPKILSRFVCLTGPATLTSVTHELNERLQ